MSLYSRDTTAFRILSGAFCSLYTCMNAALSRLARLLGPSTNSPLSFASFLRRPTTLNQSAGIPSSPAILLLAISSIAYCTCHTSNIRSALSCSRRCSGMTRPSVTRAFMSFSRQFTSFSPIFLCRLKIEPVAPKWRRASPRRSFIAVYVWPWGPRNFSMWLYVRASFASSKNFRQQVLPRTWCSNPLSNSQRLCSFSASASTCASTSARCASACVLRRSRSSSSLICSISPAQ